MTINGLAPRALNGLPSEGGHRGFRSAKPLRYVPTARVWHPVINQLLTDSLDLAKWVQRCSPRLISGQTVIRGLDQDIHRPYHASRIVSNELGIPVRTKVTRPNDPLLVYVRAVEDPFAVGRIAQRVPHEQHVRIMF